MNYINLLLAIINNVEYTRIFQIWGLLFVLETFLIVIEDLLLIKSKGK